MKEKVDRKMMFVVQKSLYSDFQNVCEEQYKTMSEVIRNLMLQYIKENKDEKINNKRIH